VATGVAWRAGVLAILLCPLPSAAAGDNLGEGEYLFHVAGCQTCHTEEDGEPLAGGRAFETPYGVFYAPNITPDHDTGIGRWTQDQFVAALKQGLAPDGSAYYPVFPYPSYRLIDDSDAGKLFDYLMSRPPVRRLNRAHEPAWWLTRWMMPAWQWWFLDSPPERPVDPELRRGQYLVDALGHCGECHTPRSLGGALDRERYLAGTSDGPEGDKVPNITPHREQGIGKWDADELDYFLESGELPDGDYTGGMMSEVIDNGTSRLTSKDRAAIVRYLRSLPALPSD